MSLKYRIIGVCCLMAATLFAVGCSCFGSDTRPTISFSVTGPTAAAVGENVQLTLMRSEGSAGGGFASDASNWAWHATPEGASCTNGDFVATEPGTYEVWVDSFSGPPSVLSQHEQVRVNSHTITVGEAAEGVSLNNHNDQAVQNGGTPPTFEFEDFMNVVSIQTYHYNLGSGVGETGEISLQAEDGTIYGPYATDGREGQGGVPNAYWTATVDIELPPGSYTVIDSDPSTWSQNSGSGGEGFVVIEGEVADSDE